MKKILLPVFCLMLFLTGCGKEVKASNLDIPGSYTVPQGWVLSENILPIPSFST